MGGGDVSQEFAQNRKMKMGNREDKRPRKNKAAERKDKMKVVRRRSLPSLPLAATHAGKEEEEEDMNCGLPIPRGAHLSWQDKAFIYSFHIPLLFRAKTKIFPPRDVFHFQIFLRKLYTSNQGVCSCSAKISDYAMLPQLECGIPPRHLFTAVSISSERMAEI